MTVFVKRLTALIVVGCVALAGTVMAESTGNKTVDDRMAAMKLLGKNMKAIAAVAKGEAEYTTALNDNAAEISRVAMQIPDLFKEEVVMKASYAKADIWANMDDFKAKADALFMASKGLIAAVETGDQGKIGAALGATGKSCGGCHKPYRIPKE